MTIVAQREGAMNSRRKNWLIYAEQSFMVLKVDNAVNSCVIKCLKKGAA